MGKLFPILDSSLASLLSPSTSHKAPSKPTGSYPADMWKRFLFRKEAKAHPTPEGGASSSSANLWARTVVHALDFGVPTAATASPKALLAPYAESAQTSEADMAAHLDNFTNLPMASSTPASFLATVVVKGQVIRGLVDTGACVSVIDERVGRRLETRGYPVVRAPKVKAQGIGGKLIETDQAVFLNFTLWPAQTVFRYPFYLTDLGEKSMLVLSMRFLRTHKITIHTHTHTLEWKYQGETQKVICSVGSQLNHLAELEKEAVFDDEMAVESHSPKPSPTVAPAPTVAPLTAHTRTHIDDGRERGRLGEVVEEKHDEAPTRTPNSLGALLREPSPHLRRTRA